MIVFFVLSFYDLVMEVWSKYIKRDVACRMNSVPLITISNLLVFSDPRPDTHIHIQVPLETVKGDQIFELQNFL